MSRRNSIKSIEYGTVTEWPGYRFGSDGTSWTSWVVDSYYKYHAIGPWRLLVPTPTDRGYLRVRLRKNIEDERNYTRYVHIFVHKLILEAFIGPCPSGMECRHLDGNSYNCRLSNLMWGTKAEQMEDRRLHTGNKFLTDLTDENVLEIRVAWRAGEKQIRLCEKWGLSRGAMNHLVHGKTWKHLNGRSSGPLI